MRRFLSLASCLFAFTVAAHADQFRLDFVGGQYQQVHNPVGAVDPYTLSDRVTGYFVIQTNGPFQANQSSVDFTTLNYSLNDGVQTLTNFNSTLDFGFTTDSMSNIRFYSFDAVSTANREAEIYVLRSQTNGDTGVQISNSQYAFFNGAGFITVTPTPEPSSFLLLGTGLVAAAGLLRRRLHEARG